MLKRLLFNRKRRIEESSRDKRTLANVEKRLKEWVCEGKHRLRYDSMDCILEELGLTGSELSFYCARRLKKTFLSWRKELRIKDAQKMLLDFPEVPVYKIGADLGIHDKSNFRHQFKSVTGFTPSEWREKYLKK